MSEHNEFQFALDHVEKLTDRRQANTSFYLSVNTGIFAVIGLLIKDAPLTAEWLTGAILMLLIAGLIACFIWRSLLRQYGILLGWWYTRLREMEQEMSDAERLVTREYRDLYTDDAGNPSSKLVGMTQRELMLNWVFTGLYAVFAVGIVVSVLF